MDALVSDSDLGETPDLRDELARVNARLRACEAALAETRRMARRARIGRWHWDLVTGAVDWSRTMAVIMDQAPEAVPPPMDAQPALFAAESWRRLMAAVARARQGGAPYTLQVEIVSPHGEGNWLEVRGEAVRDGDGRVVALRGTAQDVTAQVRLERALRENAARMRSSFTAMAEGLVFLGPDGCFLDANPAAEAILGLSRDQLLGRSSMDPDWQAVHEDGSPFPGETQPAMLALHGNRVVRGQVMGVRSPQFGERWLSVNAVPVPAAVGAAAGGVVATFVDITERRALDMQLAETGRQLQDLYDCSPCGHHSLDADGRFLRINHTGLAWLEGTREELLGRRITDFFTPEGRATFARNFPRLKTEGRLDGLEFDLVSARGTLRRVRVAATAITDADGRFLMSRSVMFDISDLHRTRQALEALSREQSAMLDSDLVGLVKVRQRHFTWVSAGAARILGYAADELHGQSTRVVYADPADHDALPAALGPDRRVGQRFRGQFRARRKDGTIVWIDLSSALLPQADGESLGLIVDITSLKAAEAHHLKLREVEAENLRLCEVGRMKDEFLAQMSHELRTPLNAVMGFTHLLQSGAAAPDSARFAGYLAKVDEGGKRLLQLVDTLLDYAKAEAGRIDFRPEPVDVAGVVQGVIEMLQESAARRQVVIAFAAGDAPPPATELDPLRLRQVLRDLIGNAVKFSHDGGRVEVRLQADGDQRLRIEIEDHGIGIAEADLPRLFKRFEQLSSGMARTAEGAGLGLALAKRLVEAQGGTVAVQSRFGAGSVFTVVLPCLPAPPAAPLPV